ncbi:penicillin-binding protein [Leifsonia xyli subsp. cynodontis DSM 46306]|uniref:PASTA domain-containing protein n=2 Tax=Leifsonia xyli TaxID=1575 RepID=U3P9Z2_LEIXC|nr:penicillin-binding protein [Leifsonia xyli subsp. cynodontis DSM 46306]
MSAVVGLLVTAAVTPAIAVTGMAANNSIGIFEGLPEYLQIGQLAQPTTIYAKNADGSDVALATFYSQNRLPVAFDQISQSAKDAAIAGEDPRFYTHGGVDIQGTMRGVLSTVSGGGVQGGSSITQQYVKNVLLQKCEAMPVKTKDQKAKYQDCVDDSTGITPDRKIKEMKYAIGLEKKYPKDEILVGYLNIAGFGGSVYGIEAAARYYYNTTAAALTPAQAASLIAIVNEPSGLKLDNPDSASNGAANGYAKNKERRDYILGKMYEYKKLTKAQYDEAVETPIQPVITPSSRGCQTAGGAAYFCDYVQRIILNETTFGKDEDSRAANFNRGGYKIYTSLDVDLQRTAEETLASYVPQTYSFDIGGVLVGVQPGTGRILYMAQNKQYSQDPDVLASGDQYSSVNYATDYDYGGSNGFQVGSTYKTFTLAEWLEEGHTLNETVNANVRTYATGTFKGYCFPNGSYGSTPNRWPTNDSSGEEGVRSAIQATQLSINTAFVSMASQLDLCKIRDTAKAFGVHTATGTELAANPASVLGTNTIAPLTMATAFAGIANGGVTCSPIAIDKIIGADGKEVSAPTSKCEQSVDPSIAAAMSAAMQRVLVSPGTAAGMNTTGKDMIAKTGTTDGNEQLWLVASTTGVAGAYWVGNVTGHQDMRRTTPTHGTSPASARTSVMRAMMSAAVAKYGGEPFAKASDKLVRGAQVTVPDLTGKTPAEAKSILIGIGLDSVDGGPQDSALPAGTVSATDPAAGASVEKGTQVTVYTSNGALVTIPNVVGMKVSDAQKALADAGFAIRLTGEGSPDAIVQAEEPGAGSRARPGTQVALTAQKATQPTPTPGAGG